MTQNTKTEIKTAWDKTVAFLIEKSDTVSENIALEIIGKPKDEIHAILSRARTDFWDMGEQYFIQEIRKSQQKTQEP